MVTLRLIPRDEKFFDLFVADGENLLAAARELADLMSAYDDLEARVRRIQALEKAGDEIDRQVAERLDRAFITPLDREDIHELVSRLDDVVDGIQECAETLVIYGIEAPTPEARRLADILAAQSEALLGGLRLLESLKGVEPYLRDVHTLENEADGLSRAAIARLFREAGDPLVVIKWRDLYHSLEEAIDAAEDVAEIMQRMIHKAA
jgi:predicted phosphate transport protein (TIGR00153 family)